jgi:hypothetical protein
MHATATATMQAPTVANCKHRQKTAAATTKCKLQQQQTASTNNKCNQQQWQKTDHV